MVALDLRFRTPTLASIIHFHPDLRTNPSQVEGTDVCTDGGLDSRLP